MKTIVYESPLLSLSGYGEHSREIATYLINNHESENLHFISTNWGSTQNSFGVLSSKIKKQFRRHIDISTEIDLFIQVGLLEEFKCVGSTNIGISACIESNVCSKEAIVKCNLMDIVIVPSSFCKEVILNSSNKYDIKLNTQIEIIGEEVSLSKRDINKKEKSEIDKFTQEITEDFCFFSVGEWDFKNDRKNLDGLISSFCETFEKTDNVALILKTHNKNYSDADYDLVHDKLKSKLGEGDSASVYLLHGNLSQTQLEYFYMNPKIKCCVFPTKGEGFGKSILQSVKLGKPTISSNWSGHTDFLSDQRFLIEGSLSEVNSDEKVFPKGSKWFNISTKKLSEKLKDIVDNYSEYKEDITKISKDCIKKYSHSDISTKYKEIISTYILSNDNV